MNDSQVKAIVFGRDALVHNMSKFKKSLVDKLVTAVEMTQVKVAEHAKKRHASNAHNYDRFVTRLGGLEQSIQPGQVYISDQVLRGVIDARMPYASYVENGTSRTKAYPFMLPAIVENMEFFKKRVSAALKSATGG